MKNVQKLEKIFSIVRFYYFFARRREGEQKKIKNKTLTKNKKTKNGCRKQTFPKKTSFREVNQRTKNLLKL